MGVFPTVYQRKDSWPNIIIDELKYSYRRWNETTIILDYLDRPTFTSKNNEYLG